jgi:deazaflavin-dependent oxidoreductase (nitroreductase family)
MLIYKLMNPPMMALLRSRFHNVVSKDIHIVTFKGRKTGKVYSTPVSYIQEGNRVSFSTNGENIWWRNLIDGAEVTLTLRGEEVPATTQVVHGAGAETEAALTDFFTKMPRDAKFSGVKIEKDGSPNKGDIVKCAKKFVVVHSTLS